MRSAQRLVRGGASAVCMGLSIVCCMEVVVWVAKALLLKKRGAGVVGVAATRPSCRRVAACAAVGLLPLAVLTITECEARASAAATLLAAMIHAHSAPFERVVGVVCSRAASRGDARSCVVMFFLACLGDLRFRCRHLHALVVVVVICGSQAGSV